MILRKGSKQLIWTLTAWAKENYDTNGTMFEQVKDNSSRSDEG